MQSKRFRLNKEDAVKILHVAGWVIASAALAGLIQLVGILEGPENLAWMIPTMNMLLVSLKKFVDSKIK